MIDKIGLCEALNIPFAPSVEEADMRELALARRYLGARAKAGR